MATFSGTHLPPVVRLGGTQDAPFDPTGGTAGPTVIPQSARPVVVPAGQVMAPPDLVQDASGNPAAKSRRLPEPSQVQHPKPPMS